MAEIIEQHHEELAAVIVEPIVQGAGGVGSTTPNTCAGCGKCAAVDILLIADEIATGFAAPDGCSHRNGPVSRPTSCAWAKR